LRALLKYKTSRPIPSTAYSIPSGKAASRKIKQDGDYDT
jgi:hypothetical protein